MSFLVLLILIIIEKFSNGRQFVQKDTIWLKHLHHIESKGDKYHSSLAILELAVMPVIIIGIVLYFIHGIFHGSLVFIVDILIMLYALGRVDFYHLLGSFRDAWRRNDIEGIKIAAKRDLGITNADIEDQEQLLKQAQQKLLWYGYEGFFAVIFWYMLLGPLPALFYRLIALVEELTVIPQLKSKACQIRFYLDWLPSRILIYSFCLVGHFTATHEAVINELLNKKASAKEFICKAGIAATQVQALQDDEQQLSSLDILWNLLIRTAVLWYAIYALVVIFVFS